MRPEVQHAAFPDACWFVPLAESNQLAIKLVVSAGGMATAIIE